jgi:hypothetical protein
MGRKKKVLTPLYLDSRCEYCGKPITRTSYRFGMDCEDHCTEKRFNAEGGPVDTRFGSKTEIMIEELREALVDVINMAKASVNNKNITHETRLKDCAVIAQAALTRVEGLCCNSTSGSNQDDKDTSK